MLKPNIVSIFHLSAILTVKYQYRLNIPFTMEIISRNFQYYKNIGVISETFVMKCRSWQNKGLLHWKYINNEIDFFFFAILAQFKYLNILANENTIDPILFWYNSSN